MSSDGVALLEGQVSGLGVFLSREDGVVSKWELESLEAQEKERAARDREGKEKLAASFGFDNFEEYEAFIKLNRGTSDKRLLKYKKRKKESINFRGTL